MSKCYRLLLFFTLLAAPVCSFSPFLGQNQEVGVTLGASFKEGPRRKVLGSRVKTFSFPVVGVRYQHVSPDSWYVGGRVDWLLYRFGDSSSRRPKKTFYDAELDFGYTFHMTSSTLLSTYLGMGKTKNLIKHSNVKFSGAPISDGSFYFLREWWYPIAGLLLTYEISDSWYIGLRAQGMYMFKKAKGSAFAELDSDQDLVEEYGTNMRLEKKWNLFGELSITYRIPYSSSAIRLTPFGRTYFNGRLLNEGVAVSNRDVCLYDVGVYLEYLFLF